MRFCDRHLAKFRCKNRNLLQESKFSNFGAWGRIWGQNWSNHLFWPILTRFWHQNGFLAPKSKFDTRIKVAQFLILNPNLRSELVKSPVLAYFDSKIHQNPWFLGQNSFVFDLPGRIRQFWPQIRIQDQKLSNFDPRVKFWFWGQKHILMSKTLIFGSKLVSLHSIYQFSPQIRLQAPNLSNFDPRVKIQFFGAEISLSVDRRSWNLTWNM